MQEAVREEHVARMQQATDHLYQQVSPCQCRMWWSKSDFRPRGILWYIFNGYFSIGHSWPLFHFICSPFHSFVNKNYNFSFYFQPFSLYFHSFVNKNYNFSTNECEEMSIQLTLLGFEPTTFKRRVSSHNH